MHAIALQATTFAVVFGAVIAAFTLGRRSRNAEQRAPRDPHPGYRLIRQYSPPVDMRVEYRNPGGFAMLRDMRILRALRRRGRLYLFGLCDRKAKPRLFRADRIICFTTLEGEVVEVQPFLIGALSIPPEFCPGPASSTAAP